MFSYLTHRTLSRDTFLVAIDRSANNPLDSVGTCVKENTYADKLRRLTKRLSLKYQIEVLRVPRPAELWSLKRGAGDDFLRWDASYPSANHVPLPFDEFVAGGVRPRGTEKFLLLKNCNDVIRFVALKGFVQRGYNTAEVLRQNAEGLAALVGLADFSVLEDPAAEQSTKQPAKQQNNQRTETDPKDAAVEKYEQRRAGGGHGVKGKGGTKRDDYAGGVAGANATSPMKTKRISLGFSPHLRTKKRKVFRMRRPVYNDAFEDAVGAVSGKLSEFLWILARDYLMENGMTMSYCARKEMIVIFKTLVRSWRAWHPKRNVVMPITGGRLGDAVVS